jgi:hypothetical protein
MQPCAVDGPILDIATAVAFRHAQIPAHSCDLPFSISTSPTLAAPVTG